MTTYEVAAWTNGSIGTFATLAEAKGAAREHAASGDVCDVWKVIDSRSYLVGAYTDRWARV